MPDIAPSVVPPVAPPVAPPADPGEIRRSLEALPRMVPVLLQGIARDDLQRAAPGAPVPWAALRTQLAAGETLLERLSCAAPGAPPSEASVQDLAEAFADQRTRLCGWLDEQVAARGAAVWDEALTGSAGSGGSGGG